MLTSQKKEFSLPTGLTYLNCAYMSPLMKRVEEVGIKALQGKANPAAISAEDFFSDTEKLRKEYAKLIHTRDPKRIVVIPSVSYGMGNVVQNMSIEPGDNIVVTGEQFPSNYYPWQRLCKTKKAHLKIVDPPNETGGRGESWNLRILEAITPKTRLLAMGNVHWGDGTRFDLRAARDRTREVGALLVIDGTQSVGALPFDVNEIQPDALICAGYKWLMGPYSIGLAYYGPFFDGGVPLEENWINRVNSEDFAGLVNFQDEYQPGSLRYEVGERSNFILVPMLLKALEILNKWKPERIQQYCESITINTLRELKKAGFWIEEAGHRGNHLFGIRLPANIDINGLKRDLVDQNILVSVRGDAVRVSPHLYNDEEDMQKLAQVLYDQVR